MINMVRLPSVLRRLVTLELQQLRLLLHQPPAEVGVGVPAHRRLFQWTTPLVPIMPTFIQIHGHNEPHLFNTTILFRMQNGWMDQELPMEPLDLLATHLRPITI